MADDGGGTGTCLSELCEELCLSGAVLLALTVEISELKLKI
jgi:hypothetical protein